jgi:hypothetical protein
MSRLEVKPTRLQEKDSMTGSRTQALSEPTSEELQFIYGRLEQLSDRQVLADMKGTGFPRRTPLFIQRCRREYAAARNVLGGQTAESPAFTAAPGNGTHADDLLGLLSGCSRRLALLPAMFIPARDLYQDCARAQSASGNGRPASSHGPDPDVNGEGAFLCHTRARYLSIADWSFDAAIPWIGIPCARGRANEDAPNGRMLYESLRQHLGGSTTGDLWTEWETLAVQYVQACFGLWNQIHADAQDLFQVVVAWARSPEEMQFSLDDGFSRTIYERTTCSGFCDVYPCGPAEYSYAELRVLLGKRQAPLLRYGKAVLLNAGAKTKDMLRMDRTAELTKERIVDPVIELHQHLISKYERSGERAETLGLQDEVTELGQRLEREFDSLLEQRVLPGQCLICSRG